MDSLRAVIYALGAAATGSLALLVWSAVGLTGDARTVVTWIFWASFIALLMALYYPESQRSRIRRRRGRWARFRAIPVQ